MKKNLLALTFAVFGIGVFAQSPRTSLFEEFTGETCPPCASTNPGLNAILLSPTNANKIIAIKWQVPIPSAPSAPWSLYQTNKAEIDWRYRSINNGGYGYPSQNTANTASTSGVNSAPSGRIDGQHQWVFGANSDHPVYISNAVIATAQSYTSAFTINMLREWNANTSAVTLTVNVTATAPFTSVGNLVFRTVMVERTIQFTVQPGSNGETKFEDVAIKSFPSIQAGTPMANTWTIGQTMTFTMNCPLPAYVRNKEEVAFVGFIQDDGDKKVAQAARADRSTPPSGIAGVAANVNITCSSQITPMITVKNKGTNAITSVDLIPYVDGVALPLMTWTGNIASGATGVLNLGTITSPTATGAHTFSYNITSMSSPPYNIAVGSGKVAFLVVGGYNANPVSEGFVAGTYPPANWTLINPDQGVTFARSIQAGAYFQQPYQSSVFNFFTNKNIGDQDELILPPVDLSGASDPEMTFDYAYSQRTAISDDKLEVKASDDCGSTWVTVWSKSGSTLATAGPMTSAFIPNDPNNFTDWATAQFSLAGFNKSNVIVKFVTTNDNGNNLYIDNVNLAQKNPVGIAKKSMADFNLNIFPNPSSGVANLNISSPRAGSSTLTVYNTIGQIVFTKEVQLTEGSNVIAVDVKEMSAGIYNVVVDSKTMSVTKKLTVTK